MVVKDNKITVTKGVGGSTYYTVDNVDNAINAINASKAIADKNGLKIDTGYLKLTGGQMTGLITAKVYTGSSWGIEDTNSHMSFGFDNKNSPKWGVWDGGFVLVYSHDTKTFNINTNINALTPATDDNSTKLATTAFVKNQKYLQRKDTVNVQSLDFNSYTSDGMYNYGGTFTNSYSNRSVFGTLVVLNNLYNGGSGTSGTYISQTAHDANGGIYVRCRNGTQGWSTWQKLVTEEYVKNYVMKKEPTRTVLMDMWIGGGDIKLSESWRNFDELTFVFSNRDKSVCRIVNYKTYDLSEWLSNSDYPNALVLETRWMWAIKKSGTTDTSFSLSSDATGVVIVIGIKY